MVHHVTNYLRTSLHGSTAFNRGKKGKGEKKVPLKRWNSLNRFFQPRSGPFSADTLKCWVINRQPTSNTAWLRLIQSHSVYETQWYGHNTQHSSALLEQKKWLDIMFRQKWTKQVQLLWLRKSSFFCDVFLIQGFLKWIFWHVSLKNTHTLLDWNKN